MASDEVFLDSGPTLEWNGRPGPEMAIGNRLSTQMQILQWQPFTHSVRMCWIAAKC